MSGGAAGKWGNRGSPMRERVPARPPPHDGRVYDTVKTLEDVESSASSSVIARAISLRDGGNIFDATGLYMSGSSIRRNFERADSREDRWGNLERPSTPGVTTLEEAIESGIPRTVQAILTQIGNDRAVEALTMFEEKYVTTALTRERVMQNPGVFLAIQEAMRQYPVKEQVVRTISYMDVSIRFRVLGYAIEEGDLAIFTKVLNELSNQDGNWLNSESSNRYPELLLLAVTSGNVAMFDRVVDVLGSKMGASQGLRTGDTHVYGHWSVRLLHRACLHGDIDMLNRLMETFPEVGGSLSVAGKWFLLEGVTAGANILALERIVELLGGQMKVAALSSTQVNVQGNRVLELLRTAIRTEQLDMAHEITRLFHLPLARADFQEVASLKSDYRGFFVPLRFEEWCPGWALVWDAASTGNMTMFNDVVRLLTPQVVRLAVIDGGTALFEAAVKGGDALLVKRVAQVVGEPATLPGKWSPELLDSLSKFPVIEIAAGKGPLELLDSATRTGNIVLFTGLEDMLGELAVKAAAEDGGAALLEAAIRDKNMRMVDRVVETIEHAVVKRAVDNRGVVLLRSAVQSADVTLVERVAGIMGQTAVKIAADKRGRDLLEDAVRLSDVNLLRRVVKILGPTAVKFALDECGTAFLKEVVSRGDVAQIELMAETLDDTLAKVVDESGAMLLGSAIIRGEVAIVDAVAEMLGETVMKTIGFRHGAGYIESSILAGDVTLVQRVTELLGPTTVKIAADENAAALLSAAVGSGNVLVLDRVAKILGSTMLSVVFQRNGLPLLRRAISHGSVIMVIRLSGIMDESVLKSAVERDGIGLLESAIRRGDVALVEALAAALGDTAIQNAAVKRVPELLGAALSCGNVNVFEHVAELIGDTLVKSMPEKYGPVLLQFVMCLGDVALVERVVEILGDTLSKIAAVEGATAFLESVISRGDVALFRSVSSLVGDEAVKKACKESPAVLLGSAVKRGNSDMIEYVASFLGPRQVEIAAAQAGVSLLKNAVRHGNVELLRQVVGILGSATVQVATDQIGPSLFKNAVRSGDAALVESVARMLGDAVLQKAADGSGMEYLEDAIRRGDVTLVNAVAKILGNQVVSLIADKCGLSLLGAALTSGDLEVFECVVGLLGESAVKSSATEAGTAFLRAAVSRGNVALVERVAGIMGEKIEAVAMENGASLLGSAIRYGDTVLLESMVKILGGTVVQSAARNGGVAFLKSAISRNDVALVRRVAEMLGTRVVRGIVEEEGYSLLHLAIRSGNLDLVEAVEDMLGNVVRTAADKNGIVLLDMAIMHGDIPLFDRVFQFLGHRVMDIAADKYVLRLLLQAVRHGDTSLVQRVADTFGDTRLSEVVRIAAGHGGTALLEYAVGLVDIFPMERVPKQPGGTSVNTAIEMIAASLLNMAVIRDKMGLIEHVADILGDAAQRRGSSVRAMASVPNLAHAEQLVHLRVVFQKCLHEIAKENAAGVRLYNKLLRVLSKQPRDEEFAAELITTQPSMDSPVVDSVLDAAVAAGNVGIVQASIDHMSKSLSLCQVVHICTACLERVRIEVDSPPDVRLRSMESLALVLQAGAKPQPRQIAQLIVLDDEYLGDLRACILSAVCSARNPFIPGTSLLVTLDAAARISPDEEQRVLQGLGDDVSRLLLEILEQLPKAVDAIPGTMATCSSLFESNAMETQPTGFTGPLGVALMHQKTMEILCTRPLVLDFMSHRFNGSLHQGGRNQDLSMEERILIEFHKNYKVPKWRMGLDVLVYLIVLVYFSKIVLLHDGPMRLPEQLSIVYVMAAYMTEISEIARDIEAYVRDRWNVLDFLALGTLAAGWGVRMFISKSLWGRALYAVAAPLLFSRLLFFAEFLPFQGPMIQVIFSMTGELLKFAVVMLVVIFGFALSFLALFEKSWNLTYGEACLYMFKAMLGDVDLFDKIGDERNVAPATVLLVLYILLMSIMLLNLLIAVLSTAHSNVHEDGAKSYKVSKARLITHYVWVTKNDVLPAPFNLIQRLLAMPFALVDLVARRPAERGLYRQAKKVVGMITFWSIFCPVVVVHGSFRSLFFLRFIEALEFQGRARESVLFDMDESVASLERLPVTKERSRLFLALPVVNTVYLVVLWLWGALTALRNLAGACCRWNKRLRSASAAKEDAMGYVEMDVSSLLEKSPGGLSVTQLQKYLDDSMSDPSVREDERTLPTKVEHLKLLRDRLEVTLTQGMERTVNARVGEVEGKLGTLTSKVDAMEEMFRSVARKIDGFGEKLDGVRRA